MIGWLQIFLTRLLADWNVVTARAWRAALLRNDLYLHALHINNGDRSTVSSARTSQYNNKASRFTLADLQEDDNVLAPPYPRPINGYHSIGAQAIGLNQTGRDESDRRMRPTGDAGTDQFDWSKLAIFGGLRRRKKTPHRKVV